MEKYRKFDDPSCGLNPFTPLEIKKKLTGWKRVLRGIFTVFLVTIRIPCILLALFVLFSLHILKYLLLIPGAIRWFEKFTDNLCGRLFMQALSFNNPKE
jgi:hypothetical protein